mmetsp:Transcript_1968/g.5975  ORF Transcript_1968/g.5975 Transcript_1968/m.5975 type:complete len:277 (+) Transcript_1968:1945-2775(+)
MLRLQTTQKFAVVSRADDAALPRVAYRDAASPEALALLRKHSYVVVDELGSELEAHIASVEAHWWKFFARADETKRRCVGAVYANERGLPMFRRGYERQEGVRECFRAPVCGGGQPWPSRDARDAWAALEKTAARLADAVLEAALPGWREEGAGASDDDFSLAYCFRYGPADGGANGGDAETLVGAHADVSLVVVEPVASVPGLEVFDLASRRWLAVEDAAPRGKALVVFGGKAFAAATGLAACEHRVVKLSSSPRLSWLYEQKYGAFFEGGGMHD